MGTAGLGSAKTKLSRAQAEKQAIVGAINSYFGKRGTYPPDNPNSSTINPLFYELTSAQLLANGSFQSSASPETLTPKQYTTVFNVGGVQNSSPDTSEIQNWFPGMKAAQHDLFKRGAVVVSLLGTTIPAPANEFLNATNGKSYTLWHYVSSSDTKAETLPGNTQYVMHNPNSFELWVDINIGGKTNRISNWSDTPEIVNDWTP